MADEWYVGTDGQPVDLGAVRGAGGLATVDVTRVRRLPSGEVLRHRWARQGRPLGSFEVAVAQRAVSGDAVPADAAPGAATEVRQSLMAVVEHGSTAGAPRPTGASNAYWRGSVEPSNAVDGDMWHNGAALFTRVEGVFEETGGGAAADVALLEQAAVTPGGLLWAPGLYYGSQFSGSPTTASLTASTLFLVPFYAPVPRPVDQIAAYCSTAGTAGHVGRLGIYSASPTSRRPAAVLFDSGPVAVDSIGPKTAAVSRTLHGLYYLAITVQSGSYSQWASAAVSPPVAGFPSIGSAASQPRMSVASVSPLSALPALSDATTLTFETGTVPLLAVRAA